MGLLDRLRGGTGKARKKRPAKVAPRVEWAAGKKARRAFGLQLRFWRRAPAEAGDGDGEGAGEEEAAEEAVTKAPGLEGPPISHDPYFAGPDNAARYTEDKAGLLWLLVALGFIAFSVYTSVAQGPGVKWLGEPSGGASQLYADLCGADGAAGGRLLWLEELPPAAEALASGEGGGADSGASPSTGGGGDETAGVPETPGGDPTPEDGTGGGGAGGGEWATPEAGGEEGGPGAGGDAPADAGAGTPGDPTAEDGGAAEPANPQPEGGDAPADAGAGTPGDPTVEDGGAAEPANPQPEGGDGATRRRLRQAAEPAAAGFTATCIDRCPNAGDVVCREPGAAAARVPANGTCGGAHDAAYNITVSSTQESKFCLPPCTEDTLDDWAVIWRAIRPPTIVQARGALKDIWDAKFIVGAAAAAAFLFAVGLVEAMSRATKVYVFATILLIVGSTGYAGTSIMFLLPKDTTLCTTIEKDLEVAVGYLSYGLYGVAGLTILYVLAARRKIRLAKKFIEENHRALSQIKWTVAHKFLVSFAVCVVFTAGTWGLLLSFARYSKEFEETGGSFVPMTVILGLQFLVLVWFVLFLVKVSNLVVAGALAAWYWTPDPKFEEQTDVMERNAFRRTLKYHLGSSSWYALNQVVVAPFGPLKLLVPLKARVRMLRPVIFNLRGSIPQIAVHGQDVASGALLAAQLDFRNAERVGRCKGIVNNLSLLGVLTVPLVVTFATINVFQFFAKADMSRVLGPVAFVLLLSCLIVVSVFSFYNTAAETLIQCFCEDVERNDGSPMHEYYMPQPLKEFVTEASPAAFRTVIHVKSRKGGAEEEAAELTRLQKLLRALTPALPQVSVAGLFRRRKAEEGEEGEGGEEAAAEAGGSRK